MTAATAGFSWRTAIVAVYGPSVLFAFGEGAVLPMIPHIAGNLGATIAVAGFIAALETVGELLGTLPSGWFVARIGERNTMFIASAICFLGAAACYLAPNPAVFGFGILLIGVAAAVFQLARQALLTATVPLKYRARALSTLGGTFRLGITLGPFLIAALLGIGFDPSAAFILQAVAVLLVVALLLAVRDPETGNRGARAGTSVDPVARVPRVGMLATVKANRRVLGTVGVGAAALMALRQSRQMILPLWAVAIALDPDTTALIIGIAALVDFALFYVGGVLMDRFGRMWVTMPVIIGLAAGHLLLAGTWLLPAHAIWFAVVAIALAVINGPGSGIALTLAADLADPRNPAPFLAVWRFQTSAGGALAPLIVSGVAALVSLPIAAVTVGVLGLGGAWLMGATLPRYDPRRRQRSVDLRTTTMSQAPGSPGTAIPTARSGRASADRRKRRR